MSLQASLGLWQFIRQINTYLIKPGPFLFMSYAIFMPTSFVKSDIACHDKYLLVVLNDFVVVHSTESFFWHGTVDFCQLGLPISIY
jgi:hypothetical protein